MMERTARHPLSDPSTAALPKTPPPSVVRYVENDHFENRNETPTPTSKAASNRARRKSRRGTVTRAGGDVGGADFLW